MKTQERRVSYWAVQGDRWCNVDGMITAKLAEEWEEAGWKIVTKVDVRDVIVFGEIRFEERGIGKIQ